MKLGKIVLKIRLAKTRFGNFVAGAAELDLALKNTLLVESAFVIPLGESATENDEDNTINQIVTERFGVIVALKADTAQADKTALAAYDNLYGVRSDLFKAILGWTINESESMITYRGGSLLGIDGAWLWYQFEFEYKSRLASYPGELRYADIIINDYNEDPDQPNEFERIYTDYILAPSKDLPHDGSLPLPDGFPDVLIPDIAQMIERTNPDDGSFNVGYASGFDFYGDKDKYRGG